MYEHMLVHLEVGLQLVHDAPAAAQKQQVAAKNLLRALRWTLRAFALKKIPETYLTNYLNWEPETDPEDAEWNEQDTEMLLQLFQDTYPARRHFYAPYLNMLQWPGNFDHNLDSVQRLAYGVLQLFDLFMADSYLLPYTYVQTDADQLFISTYHEKRVMRVGKLLSQMDEYNYDLEVGMFNGMESRLCDCPRCGSDARLYGYYADELKRSFMASALICKTCRMLLFDCKELQLAGMPVTVDTTAA